MPATPMGQSDWRTGVCAVIVAFEPEPARLAQVIHGIRSQVDQVLLVDNGSPIPPSPSEPISCIALGANRGLGAAQNAGAAWAWARGFAHVLFLDQDSIPQPGMVAQLLAARKRLSDQGIRVGAVGPLALDQRTGGALPFVRFHWLGIRKQYGHPTDPNLLPADFLIASGLMVSRTVWERVGGMDARLFIDNVDVDWCFRARALGFCLYGVRRAQLDHRLGEQVFQVWLGKPYRVYRHSPLRQYYMMRNRILLFKRKYSPWAWRVQDMFRMGFKFAFLMAFVPNRRRYARMMAAGIRDGLKGRTGPYSK